jgi:sugar phosphate isomerase/epimerase
MLTLTRRTFLKSSSAALLGGCSFLSDNKSFASPFDLPIGLQLYSVREFLPRDYAGTLKQISALGYGEVEAAGYFGRTVGEVKEALKSAGLRCPSAHYSYNDLHRDFDNIVSFNQELGVNYIICSFPGIKDPSRLKDHSLGTQVQSFTIDDWRWNADQFNQMGSKIKAAGMTFGYHNHTMEFRDQNGIIPFDELLRLTDPALVTIELDCGWVMVGGGNAVDYLKRYPSRISMLHVKDFKPTEKPVSVVSPPPAAELGTGTANYHPIFAVAKKANIKHYFVEQEAFDMPPMESLKIDANYMKSFTV